MSPWGVKAFTGYLGANHEHWNEYDATLLLTRGALQKFDDILIDVGTEDNFLKVGQLLPEVCLLIYCKLNFHLCYFPRHFKLLHMELVKKLPFDIKWDSDILYNYCRFIYYFRKVMITAIILCRHLWKTILFSTLPG